MLVECVPNFSEGRDPARIQALAAAAGGVAGCAVLDVHTDPDHHRSVLTLAGTPDAVAEAAFRAAAEAVARIDLRGHDGVHPRLGAADVVPFVPLAGATMDDCAALARTTGERLARELDLPVYLYGRAARSPERARLPWLRRPRFEGLADALASAERAPDFGPERPHPSAGATVVGARPFLVAFNVDLAPGDGGADADLHAASRRLAKRVRTSSGGLPGVHAKGLRLEGQGRVQVSMNLFDLDVTGPGRVVRELGRLAADEGVRLGPAELVGLMPRVALAEASEVLLDLGRPLAGRVLEDRLAEAIPEAAESLAPLLGRLASSESLAPGGGSAVAMGLALARACLEKAQELARDGKGRLPEAELDDLLRHVPSRGALLALANEDHQAWLGLVTARGRERGDPAREAAVRAAREAAIEVPERTLTWAVDVAEAAARLAEDGNPHLRADAAAGAELAQAAGRTARLNARANQRKQDRRDYAELLARLDVAVARARAACG